MECPSIASAIRESSVPGPVGDVVITKVREEAGRMDIAYRSSPGDLIIGRRGLSRSAAAAILGAYHQLLFPGSHLRMHCYLVARVIYVNRCFKPAAFQTAVKNWITSLGTQNFKVKISVRNSPEYAS